MPERDLLKIFISPLNRLGIRYMVTGAIASIIYGKPRLTHDLDLVIDMQPLDIEKFTETFPLSDFYCPPPEIIKIENSRPSGGHFNLIHHATGFKADIYPMGDSKLHRWALNKRKEILAGGETIWLAPVEYVILRKLEYFHEGGSEKHVKDIDGILELSGDQIDFKVLMDKLENKGLLKVWNMHFRNR
ncbi:MAG: hypothetical protein ACTSRA_13545 [Promethearchaeota archaeon]